MNPKDSKSLVELLRRRADSQPDATAFIYLKDGLSDEIRLTYSELDRASQKLAARIQKVASPGDRVLINHLPGLDYVTSFFGCLYAGAIAVPVYPPRFNQKFDRLNSIVSDAKPAASLTSESVFAMVQPQLEAQPLLKQMNWILSDTEESSTELSWVDQNVGLESSAFIQYTSGSTSDPKGVVLSHSNLVANLEAITQNFGTGPDSLGMIWLPPYHDMGLIGGILAPFYQGFPVVLMSPYSFLQRPHRWLHAISHYRATHSGAPNFAYDLCVSRINEKQMADLDLSSWEVAFCGAEPIRVDTIRNFTQKFSGVGFSSKAFHPCYGMAESTLIISGVEKGVEPKVISVDADELELRHQVSMEPSKRMRPFFSCGKCVDYHDVKIANLNNFESCADGVVGEIWFSGPSAAQGYWGKDPETRETFHAQIRGDSSGRKYLRTGDLGFLLDGELYVTGRIKDLMILRGRNYYPQDIEESSGLSHPALKSGSCAAFAIDDGKEEHLVVVQEVDRKKAKDVPADEMRDAIRKKVFEDHGLDVHKVVLAKSNSLPLTSSGKIQRRLTKARFLEGLFENTPEPARRPEISG